MPSQKLVQHIHVKTNTTKDSVCSITIAPVTFDRLWEAYPTGHPYIDPQTGKSPKGYENQCAIRVSRAIHGTGVEMKSFNGASVKMDQLNAAILATQLAAWLKLQPFCGLPREPENVTGKEWESNIKGRTGIVYFENYWRRKGETTTATGDHIDLWNKNRLTPSPVNSVRRWGINSVHWLPRFLDHLNFSDLANSTTILFWEIK